MTKNLTPTLDITLRLDELVAREVEKANAKAALAAACEEKVRAVMSIAGVPGEPKVDVQEGIPAEWTPALVVINANGDNQYSLPGAENRILSVTLGRLLEPGENGPAIPGWLAEQFKTSGADHPGIAYLSNLVQSAFFSNPVYLLGREHSEAILRSLAVHKIAKSTDVDWLDAVLYGLLRLRISLADLTKLAKALRPHLKAHPLEAIESAVSELMPGSIGVLAPRWLLEAYTLADENRPFVPPPAGEDSAAPFDAFANVEKNIITSSGLDIPRLEFEISDTPEASFTFRYNHIPVMPWPALPPGFALVDAPPERVSLWVPDAKAVLHPDNGGVCSLVKLEYAPHLAENGFFVLQGMQYLAECFSSQTGINRATLVHLEGVRAWLEDLGNSSPDLVKAVHAEYEGGRLAILSATLRRLVERNFTLNLLPQILECLLDSRVVAADPEAFEVAGEAMPVSAEVAGSDWRNNSQVLADYVVWALG